MSTSYIALEYKCNHNCICCPLSTYDRLHGKIDFEKLKENLKEIQKDDDLSFVVSGGEPTLSDNFLKLMSILGKMNSNITVLSNSSRCTDKDFIKRMIDSLGSDYNLDKLTFVSALHSSDEKIHDSITGINKSQKETLLGVKNLLDLKVRVTLKNIMNKMNVKSINDTTKFICENFSKEAGIQFCSMDYSGRCKKNIDKLFISPQEIKPYLEETIDDFEKNKDNCGRILSIYESPLCMLDPYYYRYYSISKENLSNYIAPNNESKNNISSNIESNCNTNHKNCEGCDLKNYCAGVWNSAYNIDNNIVKPIKTLKM